MKTYKLIINGERYEARVVEYTPHHAKLNINGHDYEVQIEDDHSADVPKLGEQEKAIPLAPNFNSGFDPGSGEVLAPLPGVIVKIPVSEGDTVKKGQPIAIIEAMKMESEIASPLDAKIAKIKVKERSLVQEGDILMVLEGGEVKAATPSKAERKQAAVSVKNEAPADNILRAPIPGLILEVKVNAGQFVKGGDVAVVLEAMKMESDIHINADGKVVKVFVNRGDNVQEGDPLIELGV